MARRGDKPAQPGSRRLESFIATSASAKEAKDRAQKAFYRLIEQFVSESSFCEELYCINPEIYKDVVAERSISKICGFPLCSETFEDTFGNRTYQIIRNVVYDITDRRNFCSPTCYEASEMIANQIPTTPMYVRGKVPDSKIILPDRKRLPGLHGKLIDITGIGGLPSEPKGKSRQPSVLVDQIAREGLVQCSENSESENRSTAPKDKPKSKLQTVPEEPEKGPVDEQKGNIDRAMNINNLEKSDEEKRKENSSDLNIDPFASVQEVQTAMQEWMTFETLRFTLGDKYVRGMLEAFGESWQDYDTRAGLNLGVNAKAKYVALCRKLDEQEILEEREMNELISKDEDKKPKQAMPDYEQLKRDAKQQELKVVSFFGGGDHYETLVDSGDAEKGLNTIPEEGVVNHKASAQPRKGKKKKEKEPEVDLATTTLPLIDSFSQMAWRQQIVLEKTKGFLSDVLAVTSLDGGKVRPLVKELVMTFHLGSHNISFRPGQWNLVMLIFLKLLCIRYEIIRFELERCNNIEADVLQSFGLDMLYPNRVISFLTEIRPIISKGYKKSEGEEFTRSVKPEGDMNARMEKMELNEKTSAPRDTSEVVGSGTEGQTTSMEELD